ncbi:MAG: UrcA family protein [Erythrobacter sp.]
MFKTPLTAVALGAALIAAPAFAGTPAPQSGAQSAAIYYADLNLDTAAGQEQLERRIDAAARKVCNVGKHRTGTRIPSAGSKACFAKARQSARSQMASVISETRRGG